MEKQLLKEVIDCLPRGRTKFFYFKDRYAAMLLADYVGRGMSVADVKQSAFAGLLRRPVIKQLIAQCGNGVLTAQQLHGLWDTPHQPFLLTLTGWGGKDRSWYQVSRPGYNLVLQLNFPASHDREYEKLTDTDLLFGSASHPVLQKGQRDLFRNTVAWSRIDLDFVTGEALIEEIQSDWIRYLLSDVKWAQTRLKQCGQNQGALCKTCYRYKVVQYFDKAVAPYVAVWQEAMLAAAIAFIRNELGIKVIYYHSFETGRKVKKISWRQPPRSVYTDLPRKFCFQQTGDAPEFLQADKAFRRQYRQLSDPQWFRLAI